MNKKLYKTLIIFLLLIEVGSLYLGYKSYSNKDVIFSDVETGDKNIFSMYKQTATGYKEYEGKNFNIDGFYINTTKSTCIDLNNEEVKGILTFDNNFVTVKTNKTVYCYIYFDQANIPVINNFYVGTKNGEETTTESQVNFHIDWSSDDITDFCLNNENDSKTCTWHKTNEEVSEYQISSSSSDPSTIHEVNGKITLESYNTYHFYGFIKDKYNSISSSVEDTITYTKTPYIGDANGLITYSPLGLNKESKAELYRFYGQNVENYICFGGNDCASNSNNLYRIIGVTTQGKFKLIKNEGIAGYKWNSKQYNYSTSCGSDFANCSWEKTDIYNSLNNTYWNTIPSNWQSKIDSATWFVGEISLDYPTTGEAFYENERKTTTSSGKIGLMYVSDMFYAYNGNGDLNCSSNDCSSWLDYNLNEWTMDHDIINNLQMRAYFTTISHRVRVGSLDQDYAFRPVFYLTKSTTISGGIGTKDNPFIISM